MQITDDFLNSLGLEDWPEAEREAFLSHTYGELRRRVGMELSSTLSDEQLVAFEQILDADEPERAEAWLEQHCPNYHEVIQREVQKLRQEILQHRQQLLDANKSA